MYPNRLIINFGLLLVIFAGIVFYVYEYGRPTADGGQLSITNLGTQCVDGKPMIHLKLQYPTDVGSVVQFGDAAFGYDINEYPSGGEYTLQLRPDKPFYYELLMYTDQNGDGDPDNYNALATDSVSGDAPSCVVTPTATSMPTTTTAPATSTPPAASSTPTTSSTTSENTNCDPYITGANATIFRPTRSVSVSSGTVETGTKSTETDFVYRNNANEEVLSVSKGTLKWENAGSTNYCDGTIQELSWKITPNSLTPGNRKITVAVDYKITSRFGAVTTGTVRSEIGPFTVVAGSVIAQSSTPNVSETPSVVSSPSADVTTTGTAAAVANENVVIANFELISSAILQSDTLVLAGAAAANEMVTIYVYSEPRVYTVQADADGDWTFEVPTIDLGPGSHSVEIESATITRTKVVDFTLEEGLVAGLGVMDWLIYGGVLIAVLVVLLLILITVRRRKAAMVNLNTSGGYTPAPVLDNSSNEPTDHYSGQDQIN